MKGARCERSASLCDQLAGSPTRWIPKANPQVPQSALLAGGPGALRAWPFPGKHGAKRIAMASAAARQGRHVHRHYQQLRKFLYKAG